MSGHARNIRSSTWPGCGDGEEEEGKAGAKDGWGRCGGGGARSAWRGRGRRGDATDEGTWPVAGAEGEEGMGQRRRRGGGAGAGRSRPHERLGCMAAKGERGDMEGRWHGGGSRRGEAGSKAAGLVQDERGCAGSKGEGAATRLGRSATTARARRRRGGRCDGVSARRVVPGTRSFYLLGPVWHGGPFPA